MIDDDDAIVNSETETEAETAAVGYDDYAAAVVVVSAVL